MGNLVQTGIGAQGRARIIAQMGGFHMTGKEISSALRIPRAIALDAVLLGVAQIGLGRRVGGGVGNRAACSYEVRCPVGVPTCRAKGAEPTWPSLSYKTTL